MRALASLSEKYGRGELRLTVWQTVIIPHLTAESVVEVQRAVTALGLFTEASAAAGGIIACTGSRGCKYAASDTKAHAAALLTALTGSTLTDTPLNIHFTGCAHSCAQHYAGDIGFIGAKLPDGAEGYNVVLGGGMDHEQGIAREVFRGVRATDLNDFVKNILHTYTSRRAANESFIEWTRRHSVDELRAILAA